MVGKARGYNRREALALGVASSMALFLPVRHAFGNPQPRAVGGTVYMTSSDGYNYHGYVTIHTYSNGTCSGACYTGCEVVRPAGYMASQLYLLSEAGAMVGSAFTYSPNATSLHAATASGVTEYGVPYRSLGYMRAYIESTGSYQVGGPIWSPYQNGYSLRNRASNYEENEVGESYGSIAGLETYGYMPDLISAVGVSGCEGYIRQTDLWVPVAENPQEAVEQFSVKRSRVVPLYAEDGSTQIDTFALNYGGE